MSSKGYHQDALIHFCLPDYSLALDLSEETAKSLLESCGHATFHNLVLVVLLFGDGPPALM